MPLHLETPLFESRPLSALAGRSVWLKPDAVVLSVGGGGLLSGVASAYHFNREPSYLWGRRDAA